MDAFEKKIYFEIIIAISSLVLIIIFFLLSLLRYNRNFKKDNWQQIDIELNTLERERKRMSSDLHDDFAPILANIKMQVKQFNLSSENEKEIAQKLGENVDFLMNRVREISQDLMPSILNKKSFEEAFQDYINNFSSLSKIKTTFRYISDNAIPENKKFQLYRIGQEIVYNTYKHSKATELTILVSDTRTDFVFIAEDNGIGFNEREVHENGKSGGLKNILSRTESMAGELFIDSAINKGTKYTVTIPK